MLNRHTITLLCLLLAMLLYMVGALLPANTLLLLGMLAEIAFWIRLFKSHAEH